MMRKKQSGAVLVISLIILFALTLFVLSGSQTVAVQEKMTSAVRNLHISLQIAESGVSDAEAYIETLTDLTGFVDSGTNGLYSEGKGPTSLFNDATWADGITKAATTVISTDASARYFIEDLGDVTFSSVSDSPVIATYGENAAETDSIRLFKIVSRSLGNDGNTERIVVSYYGKNI